MELTLVQAVLTPEEFEREAGKVRAENGRQRHVEEKEISDSLAPRQPWRTGGS